MNEWVALFFENSRELLGSVVRFEVAREMLCALCGDRLRVYNINKWSMI